VLWALCHVDNSYTGLSNEKGIYATLCSWDIFQNTVSSFWISCVLTFLNRKQFFIRYIHFVQHLWADGKGLKRLELEISWRTCLTHWVAVCWWWLLLRWCCWKHHSVAESNFNSIHNWESSKQQHFNDLSNFGQKGKGLNELLSLSLCVLCTFPNLLFRQQYWIVLVSFGYEVLSDIIKTWCHEVEAVKQFLTDNCLNIMGLITWKYLQTILEYMYVRS